MGRFICLLDGDPSRPLDTVARADLSLAARLQQRWFPAHLLSTVAGLRDEKRSAPALEPSDVVLAGGARSGSLAAQGAAPYLLVVHTPGSPAKAFLPDVAQSYRVSLGETPASLQKREWMHQALSSCSLLCTNSRWTAEILRRTYGDSVKPFPTVVAECVGIGLRSPVPKRNSGPYLISMVRNSPRKRCEGLWTTAALLRRSGITLPWHVLCGEDRESIETQARAAGAEGFVFHGFLSDTERDQLLAGASLFVHPAHSEHLGLGILEALLHRRTVLASRSGGPPTYLEEGKHAAFFAPDDWEDLARVIASLLSDRERARALAKAGQTRVRSRFTWGAVLERIGQALQTDAGPLLRGER